MLTDPTIPLVERQEIIRQYAKAHDLGTLVETGTGDSGTVLSMIGHFLQIVSVEYDEDNYLQAMRYFFYEPTVKIYRGDSAKILPQILDKLRRRCIFWLDAHDCEAPTRPPTPTPLMDELSHIVWRDRWGKHVILIDDARFCGSEGWPTLEKIEHLGHQFGYDMQVEDDIIRLT